MTIRVLQVFHGLGMGGAETWLMALLNYYRQTGEVHTDILITCGEARVFDSEAERLGARLHYIPYNRSQILPFRRTFQRLLRIRRYAAIHDHQDIQSGFHFLLAGNVAPPVRIAHVHNPIYQLTTNYGISPARRLTAAIGKKLVRRYATHVLGTSAQLLREYGFYSKAYDRLSRGPVHCGFDTTVFLRRPDDEEREIRAEFGWPSSSRMVLFVGRLDHAADPGSLNNHKNSGFAVNVLIEAMKQRSDLVAVFAGAVTPAVHVLKHRLAVSGLTGRIVFAGVRRDIPSLMKASDALFFPSRGEGLGMAAVEAQAAGLPVLASTAVPRECVVVPKLIRFIDLEAPLSEWVTALLESVESQEDCMAANTAVRRSPFAIEHSAAVLRKLYATGEFNTETPERGLRAS